MNDADPPAIVDVPKVTPPSTKVTVPVAPDGETATVSVMFAANVPGLADGNSESVVAALFTACESGADVLVMKPESPP